MVYSQTMCSCNYPGDKTVIIYSNKNIIEYFLDWCFMRWKAFFMANILEFLCSTTVMMIMKRKQRGKWNIIVVEDLVESLHNLRQWFNVRNDLQCATFISIKATEEVHLMSLAFHENPSALRLRCSLTEILWTD